MSKPGQGLQNPAWLRLRIGLLHRIAWIERVTIWNFFLLMFTNVYIWRLVWCCRRYKIMGSHDR